jgi:glucosamine 6-phosphate synthetase-like amidotransferase/phosphosugar isomerase protein
MCGIFGIIATENKQVSPDSLRLSLNKLFKLSESRGKEAAGLAIFYNDKINVLKQPIPASQLIKTKEYRQVFRNSFGDDEIKGNPVAMIGHSRLMTNGTMKKNENNQPVWLEDIVGVHNGIVVNVNQLWQQFPDLTRTSEVDTEIILALLKMYYRQTGSLVKAVQEMYLQIQGSASIAVINKPSNQVVIATNTGSLFTVRNSKNKIFVFGSEKYILQKFIERNTLSNLFKDAKIQHLKPKNGYLIELSDFELKKFPFKNAPIRYYETQSHTLADRRAKAIAQASLSNDNLLRCTRCILPETMPFIEFDEDGVCNYCHNYQKLEIKPQKDLEAFLAKYRRTDGSPDCLAAFSGGRDSSLMACTI